MAIDPTSPAELSLLAATLEAVAGAIENGRDTTAIECRLVRDCAKKLWRCREDRGNGRRRRGRSLVRRLPVPSQPVPVCGADVVLVGMVRREGMSAPSTKAKKGRASIRWCFAFDSEKAAEEFCIATVARLDGSVRHCYVDSHTRTRL